MEKPPLELTSEVNGLQKMRTDEILERYSELLGPELLHCRNRTLLRAEVAYRLQERFYGISLPREIVGAIEAAGEPVGKTGPLLAGTRIVRRWKGVEHEIALWSDGSVEYGGEVYRSLSAVARKITGTNWNGKLFFGLKK